MTNEHTWQALAWEVNARVAMAELDLTRGCEIAVFHPLTGKFICKLRGQTGAVIVIDFVFGLAFGNRSAAGGPAKSFSSPRLLTAAGSLDQSLPFRTFMESATKTAGLSVAAADFEIALEAALVSRRIFHFTGGTLILDGEVAR
jgi:hypothetical protein